jgi:cardiolipin synthase
MSGIAQVPNILTLSRIAAAPILILMLRDQDYRAALAVFLLAGLSDALDGWIAKRWGYTSRVGAILDPIADKILLVSCYVMLMLLGHLPFWLVLTVVFRDLLIVGGFLVYTIAVGTAQMRPTLLSKFNTVLQILLALGVLVNQATGLGSMFVLDIVLYLVFISTVASGAHYVWIWGVRETKTPRKS